MPDELAHAPFARALRGVAWKILLKSTNTPAATASPPMSESGTLIHGLLVASIFEKMSPNPPKAVTNDESVVGLSGEKPRHIVRIEPRLCVARTQIDMRVVSPGLGKERADDRHDQPEGEADEVDEEKVHRAGRSAQRRASLRRRGKRRCAQCLCARLPVPF